MSKFRRLVFVSVSVLFLLATAVSAFASLSGAIFTTTVNGSEVNGNEYKLWVTPVSDYLAGCAGLGVSNGLSVVDCGFAPGDVHGFVPRNSKTDNFKVGTTNNNEFDTRFFDEVGNLIDGLVLTWTDTLGATNQKYSYSNPSIGVTDFAHIEAVEPGTHQVTVASQPGCTVYEFFSESTVINGPGTID